MYTHVYGYSDEEVFVRKGRVIGGVAIGIIVMGGVWYPLVPGNVANATTYGFPVRYKAIEGLSNMLSDRPDPVILEKTIVAGKELEEQGCRAIVGACGYFGNYQPQVAAALNVPCFLSSLMQIPVILRALKPDQKVGVICANGVVLSSAPALRNCGVENISRVVIAGAENLSQMQNINQSVGHINNVKFEQELVILAKEMVCNNRDIGAILLECSDMPPYAWAIQKATGLPIFDFTTMINWVYDAIVRRPFAGYI